MYEDLIRRLREEKPTRRLAEQAANAIDKLQKAVLRLEDESGILDELPMVGQSTLLAPPLRTSCLCDTCAHKGNVDFDYCHITIGIVCGVVSALIVNLIFGRR